jgi:hypothetical protein
MTKKSKRTKRSKSKMKRGFETKNQGDRLKKKKFKRYKKKTKRKIRKRLTGGARFEGDPQFKSSVANRSITVSSEPIVVSPQNILDIVYNGLGLPSVIYDLLVILYVFQNDYNYDDDVDAVKEMLEYDAVSVAAVQRLTRDLELLKKLSKKTGRPMPVFGMSKAIISNHDTYDLEHICKLINEKFQGGAEEPEPEPEPQPQPDPNKHEEENVLPRKLQTKIELFINEYLLKNDIDKTQLADLEHLLELLEKDISSTQDPAVDRPIRPFKPKPARRYVVLKKAIKIVKNMGIVALEYEHTILQKKIILYRGLKNKIDDRFENRSLSFGLSLFGGLFADLGACTAAFLVDGLDNPEENPVLSVYTFNPQAQKELFYIPPLIPIASLFGYGELFHGRSKLSIEFGAPDNRRRGIQGFAQDHVRYFPKPNFGDPRHRYLKTVVTNLTNEEIKSKFTEIRGEEEYEEIELEGGRTGYKIVYDF